MNISECKEKFLEIFREYHPQIHDEDNTNAKYYQAFPLAEIPAIHFELIQHKADSPIFLEFHIERSHYWEFENIVKESLKIFQDPAVFRDCDFWTSYSSLFWRMRRPIFSSDNFEEDAVKLKRIVSLIQLGHIRQNETREETAAVCIRNVLPVMKLMKWNLRVPDYQRSYCWEKQNVLGLLNDVAKWQAKHEGQLYHIGTIVLKKYDKDKDEYDIIDGQQRLITLALTLSAKKQPPVTTQISLGQTNADNSAKYHLRQAKNTIDNWQGEIDFDHLCMSVIIIGASKSEDLAFLFFNHLNSSGKRLDDYDLLKSHHLRYIADDIAGLMAKKWDELDKVAKRELLHLVLYRLRNWMDGNASFPYNADILENHELFRNFTLDYEPMSGLCTPYHPYRLNSILASGLEFFNYTEQYKHRLQEFKEIPCVKALDMRLSGHSHGTLYFGIFALSFLVYCKFGEFYLKEAIYAIIYNVSELRNETSIRREYLAKRPVFSELVHLIDKATHEGEFLGKALDDNATYFITNRGTTASAYWHAVGALCEEQKFTDSPHIASHVIKFIADCNKKAEDQ